MQAYYETETEISDDRQLTVQLPDTIPPGYAKVAIIYETDEKAPNDKEAKKARMAEFLSSLSDSPSAGLSRAEIREYLDKERQSWDD